MKQEMRKVSKPILAKEGRKEGGVVEGRDAGLYDHSLVFPVVQRAGARSG
jgi:hypothetical protein